MKKVLTLIVACIMMMSMVALTSCGKSEFGLTDNKQKAMTLNAENADKDMFFMSGTLEVGEGEQISVTSNLEKGTVRLEFIGAPEEESAEELPQVSDEAVFSFDAAETDTRTQSVPEGGYLLKATVVEKATGTVQIDVVSAE